MMNLVVDVGQTGARIRGLHKSPVLTSFASRHLAVPGAGAALAQHLVDEWSAAGRPEVDSIFLGLTGFHAEFATRVLERLCDATGARGAIASSDLVTAHLGAIGPRPGIVVIAGTGLVLNWLDHESHHGSLGGTGWLLGDLGGGFWIGKEGILAARSAWERRGEATALLAAAESMLGPMPQILDRLYSEPAPVAAVAGFARSVVEVARAGDARATAIVEAAGREIASMIRAAGVRFAADRPAAVSLVGGLAGAGPLLLDPVHAAAGEYPGLCWVEPEGTPLDGAGRLVEVVRRGLFPGLVVATGHIEGPFEQEE